MYYYYIVDENSIVANIIVVDDSEDYEALGAIRDTRVFAIGDQWTPPPLTEEELKSLRDAKNAELSTTCQQVIYTGLDIQFSSGVTEHFNYNELDQLNIKEMFDAVRMGAAMYPYQSEDGSCRVYTAEEIITIYQTLAGNKTGNITYYHQLKEYVNSLTTLEEIDAVVYGQELTGEYLEHYNEMIAIAQEQMTTVLSMGGEL